MVNGSNFNWEALLSLRFRLQSVSMHVKYSTGAREGTSDLLRSSDSCPIPHLHSGVHVVESAL